jgi:hypothetical protein
VSAVVGPSVGRLIDRHGGRHLLAASNLVIGAGLLILAALPPRKHSLLDRLYQLQRCPYRLLHAVGLPPTPTSNEYKILVHAPINA